MSKLRSQNKKLAKCVECFAEYKVGVNSFCSESCFKKNIQKRVNEATANDPSHTSNISNPQ
jgi:hypothetical protein